MELSAARIVAASLLVEAASWRMELVPDEQVADIGWAWVFGFTDQSLPPPGSGPIVVVKKLGRAWMLVAFRRYDEQLAEFAGHLGFTHTIPYVERHR